MSEHTLYTFETANADGVVDAKQGKINGVSMITGGLTAMGHGLEVDATTLKQIHACARKMGKVPVKTNHGTGVDAVNGYLTNFRIDEDKVRGDWTMLQAYTSTPHLLEMAEKMPGCIGLSVAFRGDPETKDGDKVFFDDEKMPYTLSKSGAQVKLAVGEKIFARCEELVSTDLVASPAANPDGMFSAKRTGVSALPSVDSAGNGMAKTNLTTEGVPGAAAAEAVPAWAQALLGKIDSINERLAAVETGGEEEGSDEQEYSEEEIQALIDSGKAILQKDGSVVWADGEGGEEDGTPVEAEDADAGEGDGSEEHHEQAAEAALSRRDMVNYFEHKNAALSARMTQFENGLAAEKQAKAKRAEAIALSAVEQKINELSSICATQQEQLKAQAELITEFENGGGGKNKITGSASDITMFSSSPVTEGDGVTTFEAAVNKKYIELAADTTLTEWGRKARATTLAIQENPNRYEQHLADEGVRHTSKRR